MLTIHKSGMQTTVQDFGRTGFQKYGVVASGAMDPYALRIANLLVGNEENAAALEITLMGPSIHFDEDHVISICGGNLTPQLDSKVVGCWRAIPVAKGQTLTFGKPRSGSRCYVAVAGGIDVPAVMGSRSTYARAELGGYEGRALDSGDQLAIGEASAAQKSAAHNGSWFVPSPSYSPNPVIRITKGRQFELFSEQSRKHFLSETFSVNSQSDRMGYRLDGPRLALTEAQEMISEAVVFGSIQVPADGNPIILMADRQTAGGYPKIAEVITVDLPLISQLKPGDRLRFKEVSVEEAQHLLKLQEKKINSLKQAIKYKRGEAR
ncbi:biotin-dependent carboxyltransferase family protein [Planomicrobium sp. Y74]|uniref:5-oxoprolinase subunit C family protein n=1 Tax=Planomicrobium sp. Y74 TaxID=2478977 RepID=UPI000EF4D668|nr:biotin-dependent carboxyltransferase family protein [Planomicrobium sp. Y74]RLQ90972.1 biotin-dependent carboxyltransferase [Planomicrobium sp. Y74]